MGQRVTKGLVKSEMSETQWREIDGVTIVLSKGEVCQEGRDENRVIEVVPE